MMASRKGIGRRWAAGIAVTLLAACGGSKDTGDGSETALPLREGAYGTALTIGDLEAHIVPQLVTSPDPPGRGIDYQKYQDRREVVNSVTVRVPVNEPDTLNIRFYVESRQVWTHHNMPVVTRSRIYAEVQAPFSGETRRTLLTTHNAVHGERLQVEDSYGVTFDYMEYRDQLGDVVTIIAETDVILTEPGTPIGLVDPLLATAPPNARTTVRSNPMRIEFERRLVPPERPIVLLPEDVVDDEEVDEDGIADGDSSTEDDGGNSAAN